MRKNIVKHVPIDISKWGRGRNRNFKGCLGLKVHLARISCGHTNSSQCFSGRGQKQRIPSSSGGGASNPLLDGEFVALQEGLAKLPIRFDTHLLNMKCFFQIR